MNPILRDTIVEINLDRIAHNVRKIKEMAGKNVAIAAVVKANGYGLGAIGIAQTIMENGGDYLAVAALNEGLNLRKVYGNYPILIMGHTPDSNLLYVVENDLTQTIFTLHQAKLLNALGKEYEKKVKVHIKYDTGFNRLGFKDNKKSLEDIEKISKLEFLEIEGIFSHLALKNDEENKIQYEKFTKALDYLKAKGVTFTFKHIADSIASVDYPQYRMNMIRPGAILYGLKGFHKGELNIYQAFTFKTKISYIKELSKGEGVSYDYLWKATRDSIIGTLPFGYADGYPRNMRDKGYVTVNGKKAPIIGVICMDQCMVDLTDIGPVKEGDEVIIYGDGTDNTMSIQEASELAQTNKNEIAARITMRPPRVYVKGGKIVKVTNYL
ncbi:alanine racemase [Inediibacterium massiliense]|uniref:alanine racemase n=1 Tax=Inediibacterium massiliense TaxID=1658111 RepID=UPI0006B57E5B|nr:alanine racemase [Inediibacterium massiliense]